VSAPRSRAATGTTDRARVLERLGGVGFRSPRRGVRPARRTTFGCVGARIAVADGSAPLGAPASLRHRLRQHDGPAFGGSGGPDRTLWLEELGAEANASVRVNPGTTRARQLSGYLRTGPES